MVLHRMEEPVMNTLVPQLLHFITALIVQLNQHTHNYMCQTKTNGNALVRFFQKVP